MRIIQITPEFPPDCGGIGYYVYSLSTELIRAGMDIFVIVRGRKDREYIYKNIKIREISVPGIPPFNLPLFRRKLSAVLSTKKKDIIHIHSSSMPSINDAGPVIATAHMCMKESIPIFYRPIRDIDALYRNFFFLLYVHFEKKLVRSCNKLTVVSNSLRDQFKRYYDAESDVINNAVDVDTFKKDATQKANMLLFIGMFRVGKGILDILKIAELLKTNHPKVKIVLIGHGPLRTTVERRISKKNLFNIEVREYLSHPDIAQLYRQASIFILPSYYESMPNTILEAMATELPVVSSNVYGIPELVTEGVTGYMITPGDREGFYRRIVELTEDAKKQKRFGEMARRKVLERFTWPAITQNIILIYKDLSSANK